MDTPEEDRLEAELDQDRTVEYDGNTYTYSPQFEWATGDFPDSYPVLAVGYQQEAAERTDDQPMNDLQEFQPQENDPDSEYHRISRVSDELQVTVAQRTGFDDNGVPAHVVVQQISKSVWTQIRFALSLNTVGPNGESPMVFNIGGNPTGPYRQDDTVRSNFVFEAKYAEIFIETVDSVADADTIVNTD
jgi:hypothetical protein